MQIMRPFGAHFLYTAQQKLAEASCLLDLPEHRLDDLLSQAVAAAISGALEFLPHRLGQRAAGLRAWLGIGMLGAPCRDIGVDVRGRPKLRRLASLQ